MNEEDVEIKIEGFKASNDLLTFLQAELEKIRDLSPSNSGIKLIVSAGESAAGRNNYSSELLVNSSVFNASSTKTGNSLVDVVVDAIAGVNRKLSRWKCLRFN